MMPMLDKKFVASLVAAILATACLGFAAGRPHKTPERATYVTFANTMKFQSGDSLPAGTYRMEVPENSPNPHVTFSRDGKVVATAQATVVTEQTKNNDTEVDSVAQGNAQAVKEIRPAGWEEKLVFGQGGE